MCVVGDRTSPTPGGTGLEPKGSAQVRPHHSERSVKYAIDAMWILLIVSTDCAGTSKRLFKPQTVKAGLILDRCSQSVNATLSAYASAGDFQPRVFLGRRFSWSATASMCS